MKKTKKMFTSLIAATILTSLIAPASFAQTSSDPIPQPEQTESEYENYFLENPEQYDKYILLDSFQNRYYLKENAEYELDPQILAALQQQIAETNNVLKEVVIDDSSAIIVNPQPIGFGTGIKDRVLTPTPSGPIFDDLDKTYKEGVTKIKFHWWGTSVYVSKSKINNIGSGMTIAGIWLPSTLLKKVVATLGVAIGRVPGGVIFDRPYISPSLFNWVRYQ